TGGGVGMVAMGAGGLDVAVAMGGGPFYLTYPKVCLIKFTGQLQPWVSAKDVILKMLEIFSTKGNVGWMMEYGGPGVATLSVPERATITNMGAEMGVTTSVFPSDEETRRFLAAQGREDQWVELLPDPDALYDRVVEIDLSAIEPLTAAPHSPGNVIPVRQVAGKDVTQVEIGSCTNSSYKDMVTVAHILKGQHVHPNVSLAIAPGSRQVLQMLAREGALADLIGVGARLMESACGFCIGNSQSPQTDAVSLRTNNRNFEGRSGTKSAQVYLVSPETAAAAVITGKFTDPRDLGMDYPSVAMPDCFFIDDSMFIFPKQLSSVAVYRGPNIGDPPHSTPLPDAIRGEVTVKVGDKITTDHIMPAGQLLKYRSNVPKYAEFVFNPVDATFAQRAGANRDAGIHNLIVAGESYGQGSSREHAALCPMYLGVKAVIAKSFERIHIANLINFGIVPLTFADDADYAKIAQGDRVTIPDVREKLNANAPFVAVNETQGVEIPLAYSLSERQREILLVGGLLNYVVS
ncbi:MAG: aconitate hydratase, partial [Anaerolineae bacterium]|nr:aconitate hydratase [Anaerolineae bacterium]